MKCWKSVTLLRSFDIMPTTFSNQTGTRTRNLFLPQICNISVNNSNNKNRDLPNMQCCGCKTSTNCWMEKISDRLARSRAPPDRGPEKKKRKKKNQREAKNRKTTTNRSCCCAACRVVLHKVQRERESPDFTSPISLHANHSFWLITVSS